MRALIVASVVAIIALLATVAYQVNRTTWSDIDRKCGGIFVSSESEQQCRSLAELDIAIERMNAAVGLR